MTIITRFWKGFLSQAYPGNIALRYTVNRTTIDPYAYISQTIAKIIQDEIFDRLGDLHHFFSA